MKKTLYNKRVKIIPDLELKAFEGDIILFKETGLKEIIVKLLNPFEYEGVIYEFLIASPRHEGNDFNKLLQGEGLLCAFIRLPSERISSNNPFDTSWWRGGGAFIGDVMPL